MHGKKLRDTNYHIELNVFSEEHMNGSIEFYKKNDFLERIIILE
ncbi:hypothetical protein [Staphylococcus phage PMBT8]|nr:hypothetical protein [Staphylococcus phage PMBT8]